MSTTEEEQEQQSCNIGEEEENSNNAQPNSESTDQQDVAAEMASSLARSAEISADDGELPRPTKDEDDDKLSTTRSVSSSSTVLSPLQRKLIADQNSRVGSSLDGRSNEGRSIGNTTTANDQSITSSIYCNSTVDSHHSWNPVSSVASSSVGRSQVVVSNSGEREEEETQDVNNNQEGNVLSAARVNHQDSTSTDDIEIGQQNNNTVQQSNSNIEQEQQPQIEQQPSIAISNMDQIGNAERRQSRRRSTQETDGTPIAIPVDMSTVSQSRRSRQRVPIFNATRIDTTNNDGEEGEEEVDGRKRRQRQVCMVCFLIVIIGGLSVILGILLRPSNDNDGEKKDTSDKEVQEVVSPTTEVLSVPISPTPEPTIQPSQSISTSLPTIQPTLTTIPTEPMPTSPPTTNPTESPTLILYHADWSNQLCINDPQDRPVGYSIVQGRQPLFQTLEACCNSQFWWDVNGCLMKSNGGSATFVEQTDSPSLNPTTPPSIMMTSLSPITLAPSVSPLQSSISSSPTKSPTKLPTQIPTNQPSSKAPTRQPITSRPTNEPSVSPSDSPVLYPTTSVPSKRPTYKPTALPTRIPTAMPTTLKPTPKPTLIIPITSRPTKTPEKKWQPLGNIISGEGKYGHSVSVSLSNDAKTLAIGAPNYSNESNANIGQVQIYTWVESTWQQLGQSITGSKSGDELGSSVSLSASGLTLAVSSPKREGSSGSVSVYAWNESTSLWQQLGQAMNGEAAGDNFGFSLSISPDGRTIAASSPYSNKGGLSSGSVRIFTWNTITEEWRQLGSSINGSILSFSGWSISLSASRTVAIGARQSASGSVKVYTYDDDSMNWIKQGQSLTGDRSGDYFGHAVSISSNGSVLAIGAPRHDYQAGLGITNTGQVEIYEWSTSGIWTQIGQSINGIESGQQLGWSVDLSANGSAVAVSSYNPNSYNRGEVTVYKRKDDSWQQFGQTITGEDGWCYDVSLDGDGRTLVGSAPNLDSIGDVQVFQFTSEEET